MYPIIWDLGPVEIRSYGVMLALAFFIGIIVAVKRGQKQGFHPDLILDLSIFIIISAIIGSRLYFVGSHWDLYRHNLLDILKVWQGGLSVQGGVIMAVLVSYIYVKKHNIEFLKLADVMIPSVALGQAIGRLGCFLNGCCYGVSCDLPWGVHFPEGSAAAHAFPHMAVHPTQLYAVVYSLAIFAILLLIDKHKPITGITFFLYFVLIGIARFSIDFIRHFESSFFTHIFGVDLTVSQITSVFLIVGGLILLIWRLKKAKPPSET